MIPDICNKTHRLAVAYVAASLWLLAFIHSTLGSSQHSTTFLVKTPPEAKQLSDFSRRDGPVLFFCSPVVTLQLCGTNKKKKKKKGKKKRYYSMDFCLSGTGQLTIFSYSRSSSGADARPCRAAVILLCFIPPTFLKIFTLPRIEPPIQEGGA